MKNRQNLDPLFNKYSAYHFLLNVLNEKNNLKNNNWVNYVLINFIEHMNMLKDLDIKLRAHYQNNYLKERKKYVMESVQYDSKIYKSLANILNAKGKEFIFDSETKYRSWLQNKKRKSQFD